MPLVIFNGNEAEAPQIPAAPLLTDPLPNIVLIRASFGMPVDGEGVEQLWLFSGLLQERIDLVGNPLVADRFYVLLRIFVDVNAWHTIPFKVLRFNARTHWIVAICDVGLRYANHYVKQSLN